MHRRTDAQTQAHSRTTISGTHAACFIGCELTLLPVLWFRVRSHVNAFRQGRSLGTHLVVGVNDDESIARCKGAPPVMNDAERLAMVKGCKFVDEVVPNVPYVMSDEYVRWVIKTYNIDFVVHGYSAGPCPPRSSPRSLVAPVAALVAALPVPRFPCRASRAALAALSALSPHPTVFPYLRRGARSPRTDLARAPPIVRAATTRASSTAGTSTRARSGSAST
jgi:cytidyltransferase-like protein